MFVSREVAPLSDFESAPLSLVGLYFERFLTISLDRPLNPNELRKCQNREWNHGLELATNFVALADGQM
jgi:hypothetical protein